jgi:hypothetical protein
MPRLKQGDRVKPTEQAIKGLMKHHMNRSSKVDWRTRQGAVHKANSHTVLVYWDGCKSYDPMPVGALERVAPCAP